jgi:LysR family transcriptional regulator, glycine cleavage system transcriptional activator
MKHRLPNLTWLRTFESAARLLNFTAAGRELGLTQTAVSLHIKSLEASLGCKLFLRQPRRLALSEMGEAYVGSVRRALDDINMSTTGLFGSATKHTITVKAPISTVTLWLAPLLPDFLDKHPTINIRLISRIWADSIADEDVDIDLRLGYGDWPGMNIEKLSEETIVPVCARSAAENIKSPADLPGGNLIHILGYEDNWERYLSARGVQIKEANIRCWVDTTAAAFELVAADGGYATFLTRFAQSAVRRGCPVAIAGPPIAFPQAHYITHVIGRGPVKPEVELFKSWLRARFEEKASTI